MGTHNFMCVILIIVKVLAEENLHLDMTESELRATFGFTDTVPDYEIVTVEESRSRLRRDTSSTVDTYRLLINRKDGQIDIQLYQQRELVRHILPVVSMDEKGETTQAFPAPDCIYKGEMDNGIAALSSCDGNGMTGVVITPDDAYVLKPVPKRVRTRRSLSIPSNSHILYKVTKPGHLCGVQNNLKVGHLRSQRSASDTKDIGTKTIEIAVVIDDDMYKALAEGEEDPDSAIVYHVLTMMNGVQLLYEHPTMTIKFNIVLVKIIILKSASEGPKKEDAHIHKYLRRFSMWQEKKNEGSDNTDPQHWDHALMLSGLDLHMDDSEAVIGLAWVSGMCNKRYSTSINEGLTMESVYVISHEMGHNLGMEHDGDGNDCSSKTHIMSPSLGPGKTAWSDCSNKGLKKFLR